MEANFETLTANLDALDKFADRAIAACKKPLTMRNHYHRLLMKCAARMTVEDFTAAIKAAEPGPLADDIEEARR